MSTPLTLTVDRHADGTTVLTATGEIDTSNADTLASTLTDALATAAGGPLTLDLTAVHYLDSAGLAALFPHAEHLQIRTNTLLEPVLTISGLAILARVHTT